MTLPAAFETSPAAASSGPGFLPLPAARSGEIRLLGSDTPFVRAEPNLCTAGQRMLSFYFFNRAGPGGCLLFEPMSIPAVGSDPPTPSRRGGALTLPPSPFPPRPPPPPRGGGPGRADPSPRPGPPQPPPRGRAARGAAPPPPPAPAPCPFRDRAPPHLPCPTLTFPARPPRGSPPPAPAPRPVSAIPAEGVPHAAAPAEPRLSPCAHSAGAGSPAGFIRGQRRLRAAARLAANAAAGLTLPRPGGDSRRPAAAAR